MVLTFYVHVLTEKKHIYTLQTRIKIQTATMKYTQNGLIDGSMYAFMGE